MPGLSLVALVASLAPADPSQLLPAREQMAFTLGFHIILVPFGVAFTFLMMIANCRGIRRDDADALLLARRWSKVAAVLFAVGAVSGTVLSFEMGLLWPGLMGRYGAAYGIPFAVEGLFFFLEAIFVAIYIYGWKRLRPWPHFWTGAPGRARPASAARCSVVAANGWMNPPGGITMRDGKVVDVRPLAGLLQRRLLVRGHPHAAGRVHRRRVHRRRRLRRRACCAGRRDRYHRLGLLIPLTVAAVATPLQIFVGDVAAREVFQHEPAKFAAIEALPRHRHARARRRWAGSSSTARSATASGSRAGPRCCPASALDPHPGAGRHPRRGSAAGPPGHIVHLAFDVMVGTGFALLGPLALVRRGLVAAGATCRAAAGSCGQPRSAALLAVVALEAGWVVTEVGRQPWTVVGLLLTRDAVTTSGNLWLFFAATVAALSRVGVTTVRGPAHCCAAAGTRRARGRRHRTCPTARLGTRRPQPRRAMPA